MSSGSSSSVRPSPLIQLLKEVPGYANSTQHTAVRTRRQPTLSSSSSTRGRLRNLREEGQSETPVEQLSSAATSNLVGRRRQTSSSLSATFIGAKPATSTPRTSTAPTPQRRQAVRSHAQKLPDVVALEQRASSPYNTLRVNKAKRAISTQRYPNTSNIKLPSTSLSSYNHLPEIKRPSLSSELRRRVLVNASITRMMPELAAATPNRRGERSSSNQQQQQRIGKSPVNAVGSRGSSRTRKPRVRLPLQEKEADSQNLTMLVKGMCHTMEESMVREKLKQFLQHEAQEEDEKKRIEKDLGKKKSSNKPPLEEKKSIPPEADFSMTGASTRVLRQHLTSGKISHKKEVLERAYGWESRFLDESDIEEQVGRTAPIHELDDESAIVPIGESVTSSERGIENIRGAGSVPSKSTGTNSADSKMVRLTSGNDWVDVDGPQNPEEDTIIERNGIVRKGAVKVFQLDPSKMPLTPIAKPKRQPPPGSNKTSSRMLSNLSTTTLLPSSPPLSKPPPQQPLSATEPASQTAKACGPKRTFQRFDTVQGWLDHQNVQNRQERHVQIVHPPKLEKSADPQTPRPNQSSGKLGHLNTPLTPSTVLFEKKYTLSLAHLPYIKHTLKSNGRGIKGGTITISPRTDNDPLGYIHLDLKGKRYIYTIVPGGKGTPKTGRRTLIILHPRNSGTSDVDRTYEISELPVKHLSVLKLANKFLGIVRRGTVIQRIEGQPGHGSASVIPAASCRNLEKWEWYRGEAFADGRFEFTVVPRGGFASGQSEYIDGETDRSVMSVGGMVRIVFSNDGANSKATTDGVIPRFNVGTGHGGKFKRVYAEINRAPTFSPSQSSIRPDLVWEGWIELGYSSNGAIANVSGGETDRPEVCGGFAEEVDWARRAWIECRRLNKGV
ncbi:hypothetical protein DFH27DRAFT_540530 [Peziza echinospora]|nr:hypothetical protein DFH27DRAFT_540530 [Peziza echinospora]